MTRRYRDREIREMGGGDRQGQQTGVASQARGSGLAHKGLTPEINSNRPGRHPEHCRRDGQKRKVIPTRHREESSIENLYSERREGRQKETQQKPSPI